MRDDTLKIGMRGEDKRIRQGHTKWSSCEPGLATSKLDACYTNSARLLVRTLDQRPSVDSLKLALSNPM